MNQSNACLPMSRKEMKQYGWSEVDFVCVSGDAYVDHPSFGLAIISRILERHGYRVGIISQPDWKNKESIAVFGEPRFGFLVSSGNMDSMVNHYSVFKKRRSTDAYTAGGKMGKRPDYAVAVYGNLIRQTYKKTPIILGGIEASLRRLAHYDYWSNKIKRSVLLDAGADMIVYGMAEKAIVEVADALASGIEIKDLNYINGTVVKCKDLNATYNPLVLPDFTEVQESKEIYAKSFYQQYQNTDPFHGKQLVEPYAKHLYVVQNPPALPLSQLEMDDIYALPYTGEVHPSELEKGKVGAIDEIRFSLTSSRGCFGGCTFCSLTFHQGRIVQNRSHASILQEAQKMIKHPAFKGYIHDVGGPTANFRHPSCQKQLSKGVCKHKQCLFPSPCKELYVDHRDYLQLLRKLRKLEGVKKVFIRSGIRFDYLTLDKAKSFLTELCQHHISGQLRVAPEHVSEAVLQGMGKSNHAVYQQFVKAFERENQKLGKKQFIVPYLMSSHPASTLQDGIKLAEYCRDLAFMPEQVQDFYPTPSTIATCMYHTGIDPRTMKAVYVAKSSQEKALQRALIHYRNPKNYALVLEALKQAGRQDLIGFDKKSFIKPRILAKAKKKSIYKRKKR
ncbi:MAG: YgiQ family radical SAM protein [Lachnospiraceae bacterium]|nr:YgiQ family radical SAM protein [Lachnospiraceae bacterium]